MDNEERLKGILARQAAEAERKRSFRSAEERRRIEAEALKDRVIAAWNEKKAILEGIISELNGVISENGKELFFSIEGTNDARRIGRSVVSFHGRRNFSNPPMDIMAITVSDGGSVNFRIGTQNTSPVAEYSRDVFELTREDLIGSVLDFMDHNTPGGKTNKFGY